MSEFETNEQNNMNNLNEQNTQNNPNQENTTPAEQTSAWQQPASENNGNYRYGQFTSNPIPPSTQSGYYTYRTYNPEAAPQTGEPAQNTAPASGSSTPNFSANGYTAPAYTAPVETPKKEKKNHTVLTAVISCLATAAVLVGVFFAAGGYKKLTATTPVAASSSESSAVAEEKTGEPETAESSEAEEQGPADDAFEIQESPSVDYSEVNEDGTLTTVAVAAKVKPSVVCVEIYSDTECETLYGEGSGIVFTEDGYIITNAHVVEDAVAVKVILYDGTELDAYIVGYDTNTDLAVIRADTDEKLTPAEFGDSDSLQQGEPVMVVGNPGGLAFSNSVTYGVVSGLNRQTDDDTGYALNLIQTDAAINPGNSGGPLVNMYGQVVGIASSKIAATSYEGLCFAISINEAQPIISELKEYGYVRNRPYLGITYQFIDETISRMYGMPVGAYVYSFTTDTMSKAGIEVGDVLTSINGEEISSSSVLTTALSKTSPGDQVEFEVYRPSTRETFTATVTVGEYSPEINAVNG